MGKATIRMQMVVFVLKHFRSTTISFASKSRYFHVLDLVVECAILILQYVPSLNAKGTNQFEYNPSQG
jgi:hypothetical protein